MKNTTNTYFSELFERCPQLDVCRQDILDMYTSLLNCFLKDGMLLICGNGGSAADADHIVGELAKSFVLKRPLSTELKNKLRDKGDLNCKLGERLQYGLRVINLAAHTSLSTAIGNDIGYDTVFAQQVVAYGRPGDVLLGISTSGNSQNVINAGITANALGIETIAFTGKGSGGMTDIFRIAIRVPDLQTYHIQEFHLKIYHTVCLMLESELFDS